MAKKITGWKTKGMNRDLSVSAFNPEFSFENMNLRLSTNEGNTLLSWVNEKGTQEINYELLNKEIGPQGEEYDGIYGNVIGTAVLNHQLVFFTTRTYYQNNKLQHQDRIYKCWIANKSEGNFSMDVLRLFLGDLNLSEDHPLETLTSYEAEHIQKVYWTDGKNQPRVINIYVDNISEFNALSNPNMFDFVPTLRLFESVYVKKIFGANGMFAPGVIQYALTYYNKYGQESNIFYTTHLCYISHLDRGASPDDTRVDNAFEITVTSVDKNFDYLRIYSIQRTSINGTPICKRVHDISIKDLGVNTNTVTYIDRGVEGDTIDPTELLYKGGEMVTAKTFEQKDDTLFLGNVKMLRNPLDSLKTSIVTAAQNSLSTSLRRIICMEGTSTPYVYANQLNVVDENYSNDSVPCNGFKYLEKYRCGLQFQHKSGKWSDPIYINDHEIITPPRAYISPSFNNRVGIELPIIKSELSFGRSDDSDSLYSRLIKLGYKKVRPVIVTPNANDRKVVCQGVVNSTMYISNKRTSNDIYAQSSWFFRPNIEHDSVVGYYYDVSTSGVVAPTCRGMLPYMSSTILYSDSNNVIENNPDNPKNNIRAVEVQGDFNNDSRFQIDTHFVTLHSPDVEFDSNMSIMNYSGLIPRDVAKAQIAATLSDINIQTETPTINNNSNGFIHKAFSRNNSRYSYGIVSGLFYEDFIVDDTSDNASSANFRDWDKELSPVKWMIYPWQKRGSLNNDINRPANKGVASSTLKKKVISNLRYTNSYWYKDEEASSPYKAATVVHNSRPIALFSEDSPVFTKVADKLYQGNVDMLLTPDSSDGMYFAWEGVTAVRDVWSTYANPYYTITHKYANTPFTSTGNWWKTFHTLDNDHPYQYGIWFYSNYQNGNVTDHRWASTESGIGDAFKDLVMKKEAVPMKYKSTPHLILDNNFSHKELDSISQDNAGSLQIAQLERSSSPFDTSPDSDTLRSYTWIPCGNPVNIVASDNNNKTVVYYSWGDTYYQRYDCLKTYPFTNEDINQIVEIGSFMLETRVNIDGRYDRNRGQINNTNVSPRNFNLINPVYSQLNNFFSYKIQNTDEKESTLYPNYVFYSQTKTSGSDVDMWTHVTLASVLEMDGDKGQVNSLQRFNNQLIAFQDTGISQILYNENTQITTTDGVPIEIANSGKVQGKRYLSNTIGCSNKWSIVQTPSGIYFIDSHDKSIYFFNGQLQNLSTAQGFNTWAKKNITLPLANGNADIPTWTPDVFDDFVSYYDKQNQDVLFINANTALAYSEKVGAFTSFYDYGHIPYFCNLDDYGIWLKHNGGEAGGIRSELWLHQKGNYCDFFTTKDALGRITYDGRKPYWMTLVGNPEPQMDKIFTNLEFRACVDTDGTLANDKFTPLLPFDYLETWNEHQHGKATLQNKNGHGAQQHHLRDTNLTAALKRKFRIWRCDIPRDNYPIPEIPSEGTQEEIAAATTAQQTFFNEEADKGIYRKEAHPIDRMRNPWLYLKLMKNAAGSNQHLQRTEIHDILMSYFS